jgi:cell division protein FtsN
MKAFSSPEDAEKLAERLRRNGHDVRVETGEANGRTWHRVRMGHFDNWEAAVSAKAAFEKNEQVIAYVVTL